MRLLVVHPGASMSTHDVHTGVCSGLRARGHELYEYALDARIERSGAWLTYCWKKGGKALPQPTSGDIVYHASCELVTRALRIPHLDAVVVVSGMFLHPDVFVIMRRAHLRVVVLFTESPYDDERQARLLPYVDVAWTNERISAVNGVRYLPHAYDPAVHAPTETAEADVPAHQVLFIGTGFQERIDLLAAVDWTGINLGIYGTWDMVGSRSVLRQYLKNEYVDNDRAAAMYRRADIGLNLYRQSKGFGKLAPRVRNAESLNPRAYELAATGCFSISDHRAEVAEVFGDLVPTFTRPEEVRPLVDRWLADENSRKRVSAQLPSTVTAHTWHRRAAQMEHDMQGVGIGASLADGTTPASPDMASAAVAAGG